MAVFTRLEHEDIKAILLNYKIGDLVSFKEISEGVENTNYLIETTNGKHILTIFEKRVSKKDLPFFLGLMDYLSTNNFPSPKIHRNDSGNLTFNFKAKTGVIISFLEGIIVEKTELNDEIILKAGAKLADMHNITQSFSARRENEYTLKGITKLFQGLKLKRAIPAEHEALVKEKINYLQTRDFSELPKGVIHADFFPDNVFAQNNQITGVIDFYFACYDYLNYDIATTINAWCFDKEHNFKEETANNLLSGYESIRKLSAREKYYLKDFCLLTSIRFYLTRTFDKTYQNKNANVTIKNPNDYYKRLEFFSNFNGF